MYTFLCGHMFPFLSVEPLGRMEIQCLIVRKPPGSFAGQLPPVTSLPALQGVPRILPAPLTAEPLSLAVLGCEEVSHSLVCMSFVTRDVEQLLFACEPFCLFLENLLRAFAHTL